MSEAAGGNTLWSPSYMRLDAPDRVAPDFEAAMGEATGGRDAAYFHALARDAAATVGWLEGHGVAFSQPPYYLAAGPLRIQPVGGGRALIAALSAAAKRLGVTIRYGCAASDIVRRRARRHRRRRRGGRCVERCRNCRRRCGRSRLRRLPGRPRDDARAFWTGRRNHAADLAGHAFQLRRRHPHRHRAGCAHLRRLERHARRAGRSAQPRIPRLLCWSTLTASSSTATAGGFSTKAAASSTRPGRRSPEKSSSRRRAGRLLRFSTAGSSTFRASSAPSGRRSRRLRPTPCTSSPRWPGSMAPASRRPSPHSMRRRPAIPRGSIRRVATGSRRRRRSSRRNRTGRARSRSRRSSPIRWSAPSPTPSAASRPMRARGCSAVSGPLPGLFAAGEITGHFWGTAPNAVSVLRALVFGRTAGREAISYFEGVKAR